MRCHNCQKLGHYARDCWQREGAKNKPNNQANLAQDEGSDSKVVMLMATTSNESSNDTSWYLDSGFSTHITGRKEWFISLDDSSKRKVRLQMIATSLQKSLAEWLSETQMEKEQSLRRFYMCLA